MKILLVAATALEMDSILKQLVGENCSSKTTNKIIYKNLNIDVLITGIGLIFTCYHLTKALNNNTYDLVINIGIAGSFNKNFQIGEVVNVMQEEFSDLGIESPTGFQTIFESGFMNKNKLPFVEGKLMVNMIDIESIKTLNQVRSISSNTAHGNETTIHALIEKYNPDIESMEGAAFFYVCQMGRANFLQIRAISNYVEARNVQNWNIKLALENLSVFLVGVLDGLDLPSNIKNINSES